MLKQVANGAFADLKTEFPNESDRVLRPAFLQDLFTREAKNLHVGRIGIQIANAVMKDDADLEFLDMPYDVALFAFRFEKKVDFSFSNFRKNLEISGSTFAGPVYFSTSNINGTFRARNSQFRDQSSGADFEYMRVGGLTALDGSNFDGPVSFIGATIEELNILETRFNDKLHPPSFLDTKVGTLSVALVDPDYKPRFAGHPTVDGMTFQRIHATWGGLLMLCEWSEFSHGFYSEAEVYLRKTGQTEYADELYIRQKRRERKEQLRGFSWVSSYFLDVLVAYGRKPQRALCCGLAIVAFGYFVFRGQRGMTPRNTKEELGSYNAFWYSLDLFAPVIDLQIASNWMPEESRWFARNYMHLQRILGWILVPIGIAAWTGIVK